MADYIDKEKLGICKCNLDVFENKDYAKGWNSVIELLEKAPTEDVALVKHGEWILKHIAHGHYWDCSICRKMSLQAFDYCPKCGAKMDGDVK